MQVMTIEQDRLDLIAMLLALGVVDKDEATLVLENSNGRKEAGADQLAGQSPQQAGH